MWQSRRWLKTQLEIYKETYERLINEAKQYEKEIANLNQTLVQEASELKEAKQKIQELECLKRYWNITSIDILKASKEEAKQLGNFLAIMGYKGTLVKETKDYDLRDINYRSKETLEVG